MFNIAKTPWIRRFWLCIKESKKVRILAKSCKKRETEMLHKWLNTSMLPYFHYTTFGSMMQNRSWSAGKGYRYGFNGQEGDAEIGGEGNTYTAEYWQYDSRLGRRWNVDPVYKHYQTKYSTFSNNPISRIDPDGADDFFDKYGNYLGRVGKGSTIKIIDDRRCFETIASAKMSVSKMLKALDEHNTIAFKEFDFNKSNLDVASKIITHYYKNTFSTDKLHNGKISIIVNDAAYWKEGRLYKIEYNDGVPGTATASAWTTFNSDGTFKITFKMVASASELKGHFRLYAEMENGNDINVLLRHEDHHARNHRDASTEGEDNALVNHLDSYYSSISEGDDWEKTSEDFRESYSASIVDYINEIKDKDIKKHQKDRFADYLSDKHKDSIETD